MVIGATTGVCPYFSKSFFVERVHDGILVDAFLFEVVVVLDEVCIDGLFGGSEVGI